MSEIFNITVKADLLERWKYKGLYWEKSALDVLQGDPKFEDISDKLSLNLFLPWFLAAQQDMPPTVSERGCEEKLMSMNFLGNMMRVAQESPWGHLCCSIQCRLNTDAKKIWGQKYWIYSVSISAFSQQMDTVCFILSWGKYNLWPLD